MSDHLTLDVDDEVPAELTIDDGWQFAMIPEWLLADLTVPHSAKIVWCWLHRHAGNGGRAWPGRRRLADLVGCTPRSITTAIGHLERVGAITVTPRLNDSGQRSNLYTLHPVRRGGGATSFKGGVETRFHGGVETSFQQNESHSEREPLEREPTPQPPNSPAGSGSRESGGQAGGQEARVDPLLVEQVIRRWCHIRGIPYTRRLAARWSATVLEWIHAGGPVDEAWLTAAAEAGIKVPGGWAAYAATVDAAPPDRRWERLAEHLNGLPTAEAPS